MSKIERDACLNLGGLNRIWLANQLDGEASIIGNSDGIVEIILDRQAFTEIEFETGELKENLLNDNAGDSYSYDINFLVRRERQELLQFERQFSNRRLLAVCYTNNGDWRIARNLTLTRAGSTGVREPNYNRFNYSLKGNGLDNITFGIATQAIFWLQSRFAPNGSDTFDPEIVFTGDGKFRFANLVEEDGNSISIDGIAQGLNGNLQTIAFDSDTGATGITELRFRDDAISGKAQLHLLPNLVTADLALNQIEEVTVGSWVNNANVVIELRNNQISPQSQEQFLEDILSNLSVSSSNMKIGILNQSDGNGNVYLPTQGAIDLAVLLYQAFGIEIYIEANELQLEYGID